MQRVVSVWQPDRLALLVARKTAPGLVSDRFSGMKTKTQARTPPAPQPMLQTVMQPLTQPLAQAPARDFARIRRIVKTDEFSSVFHLRPVSRTGHFVLYARANTLTHARLGVVAAKRLAPRAVTRNTVKRITRELFRIATLPAIDCIVRLSKPVNIRKGPATSGQLKSLLRTELQQLFASQCTLPRNT